MPRAAAPEEFLSTRVIVFTTEARRARSTATENNKAFVVLSVNLRALRASVVNTISTIEEARE
jgi:hypothetical protein